MAGKHYRSSPSDEQQKTTSVKVQPQKEEYEDLYSYEEPYGAKRGTRQAKTHPQTAGVNAPDKKKSIWPPVAAVACLFAAAGILAYIVWDLGIIGMILAMLG